MAEFPVYDALGSTTGGTVDIPSVAPLAPVTPLAPAAPTAPIDPMLDALPAPPLAPLPTYDALGNVAAPVAPVVQDSGGDAASFAQQRTPVAQAMALPILATADPSFGVGTAPRRDPDVVRAEAMAAEENRLLSTLAKVREANDINRPTEQDYNDLYAASPTDGEVGKRVFLLRHGINPDDKRAADMFLQYNDLAISLGYTPDRLATIADNEDGIARRAAVSEMLAGRVEDYDTRMAQARSAIDQRLSDESDATRETARAQQRALIMQRMQADIVANNAAQQANRANSYFNPVAGKIEYLPSYNPRDVQQQSAIESRYRGLLERLDSQISQDDVRAAERQKNATLRQFDAENRTRRAEFVRGETGRINAFMQARLEDVASPEEGTQPFKTEADVAAEKKKARTNTAGGAAQDIGLSFVQGAGNGVLGILGLGAKGYDVARDVFVGPRTGTDAAAAPSVWGWSDSWNQAIDNAKSEASRLQAQDQAEAIQQSTQGKTGVAAALAAAKAGATTFGMDTNTFGQIAGMLGAAAPALATGGALSVAGRAAGLAGESAAGVGGVTRALAGAGFVGQSAEGQSRQAAQDFGVLLKEPTYRAQNKLIQDLQRQFPNHSREQIDKIATDQVRSAAALGGAAVTFVTLGAGIGGLEGQLLRTGLRSATSPGVLATAGRAAGRALQEGVQEGLEQGGAGVGSWLAGGQGASPEDIASNFGAGVALGGAVGNVHAAFNRAFAGARPGADANPPAPASTFAPPVIDGGAAPAATPAATPAAGPVLLLPAPAVITPSPEQYRAQLAAQIAGTNVSATQEIEQLLKDIGRNVDRADAASVGALVREQSEAAGVPLPEFSTVSFAGPQAHAEWVRAHATPEDTIFFATPAQAESPFALTRRTVGDNQQVIAHIDADGNRTVITPETTGTPAERTAAVIASMQALGSDIRAGERTDLALDTVLLRTAEDTRAAAVEDYRQTNNSVAPQIMAQTAVQSMQRAADTYASLTNTKVRAAINAALQAALPEDTIAAVGSNPVNTLVGRPDIRASLLSNAARLDDSRVGRAAKTAIESMVADINSAEHEGRLAEQRALDEGLLPANQALMGLDRVSRQTYSGVIGRPVLDMTNDQRARALAVVPNFGRTKPGSVAYPGFDAETAAVQTRHATLQLADVLRERPTLTVAQARNLALHFSAGQADVVRTVNAAVSLAAENLDLKRAARLDALQLSEIARQREAARAAVIGQGNAFERAATYARRRAQSAARETEFEAALVQRGQQAAEVTAVAPSAQALEAQVAEARQAKAVFPRGFPQLGAVVPEAQRVAVATLQSEANRMADAIDNVALSVRVIANDSDPLAGGNRGFRGLTVNNGDGTYTVLLNAERIDSVETARLVLQHEVYGHFTPMQVLGRRRFARLQEAVLAFARKDPAEGAFLRSFIAEYTAAVGRAPALDVQGAEVLAHLVDTGRVDEKSLTDRIEAATGKSIKAGDLLASDMSTLLRVIASRAEGRDSIEEAHIHAAMNSIVEPGDDKRRQTFHQAERTAFTDNVLSRIWSGLNSQYYLLRVGRTLVSLVSQSPLANADTRKNAQLLTDQFTALVSTAAAKSNSVYNSNFERRWHEVHAAVAEAAAEAGVSREQMVSRYNELLLARHAVERNLWGIRIQSPLTKNDAAARKAALSAWKKGDIDTSTLAMRLDDITTDAKLRSGMEDKLLGEGITTLDEAQHKYKRADASYAGKDMTIPLAQATMEWLAKDAVLVQLDARLKPTMDIIRARMLDARRRAGFDPHGMASLFTDYVPITPEGERTGFNDFQPIMLEFSTSTVSMQGLGEKNASRHQLATMEGLSHLAADEQVNQQAMLSFKDVLTNIAALDPEAVRILGPGENMAPGLANLATIKNVGSFKNGGRPDFSANDSKIAVRDGNGDFWEILVNDKNLRNELDINKNGRDLSPLAQRLRFVNRTIQGSLIQYNPVGVARNAFRDVQQAIQSGAKWGVGLATGKYISDGYSSLNPLSKSDTATAMRGYFLADADARQAYMSKEFAPGSPRAVLQEFVNSGAHQLFRSYNSIEGEIGAGKRDLFEMLGMKASDSRFAALRNSAAAMEKWRAGTELVENIPRFALYRALREKGVEPNRAAELTTKMVLDYNQTSAVGRAMTTWFFFANPAVVDLEVNLSRRIWKDGRAPVVSTRNADGSTTETLAPGWWKNVDTTYLGIRLGLMTLNIMLLGAVLGPDEWKKLKLEDLANNFIIPGALFGSPEQVVRVTKPYGVDRILDAVVASALMPFFGAPQAGDMARDMFNVATKNLSPGADVQMRDGSNMIVDLARAFVPSVALPTVDFGLGVDRFGRKTSKSDFYKGKPGFRATSTSTPDLFYDMAKSLYAGTGGFMDLTGEQLQQYITEHASFVPFAGIFASAGLAFGRGSAQSQLNEASGRPGMGPVARFANAIGSPIKFGEADRSPEAQRAVMYKDFIQPFQEARAWAQSQDQDSGAYKRSGPRRADSLAVEQMGPAERALFAGRPEMLQALAVDRKYKREVDNARAAVDDARATGNNAEKVAAQVRYREVAAKSVREMKIALRLHD